MTPETRICERREALHLEPSEIASRLGISAAHVWDLDGCEGEFVGTLSLGQAARYAELLNLSVLEILGEQPSEISSAFGPIELQAQIKAVLTQSPAAIDKLSWDIAPVVANPENIFDYPIDALIDLAKELGFDWRAVVKNGTLPKRFRI